MMPTNISTTIGIVKVNALYFLIEGLPTWIAVLIEVAELPEEVDQVSCSYHMDVIGNFPRSGQLDPGCNE